MRVGLLALRWNGSTGEPPRGRPAEVRRGKSEDASCWLPADAPVARPAPAARPHSRLEPARLAVLPSRTKLLELAGLPRRRNKTHALRRSFATLVAANGGDPSAAFGHSDPTVAKRYYLDPDATDQKHAGCIPERARLLAIARIADVG